MSYKLVRWENETVTPKHDSMQWDDGRIGILNGCEITSLGANKLRIASGYMVVLGRLIEFSQTDINCEVSSSGTLNGQMILRLDLDASNPVEIVTEASASLTPLTQNEDFNYENGIYEVQLATYNINETTISNLVVKVDKPTGLKEVTENLTTSNNQPFKFTYDSESEKYGYTIKEAGTDVFVPFNSGIELGELAFVVNLGYEDNYTTKTVTPNLEGKYMLVLSGDWPDIQNNYSSILVDGVSVDSVNLTRWSHEVICLGITFVELTETSVITITYNHSPLNVFFVATN